MLNFLPTYTMENNRNLKNPNVHKPGIEYFVRFMRDLPNPSPKDLFQKLNELGYCGQERPRRALCLMAYRHIRRVKKLHIEGVERNDVGKKSNYLMVGPTGCGKTHLVELLFDHLLNLPTARVDVTTYSETGYVGQDPSAMLTRLLHAAGGNPLLASVGVVCLDEFDKICSGQNNAVFAGAGTTKDVTGMGVQRELLKMLESSDVIIPAELASNPYGEQVILSTADIAFIGAGAFSGFQQIAHRRNAKEHLGFGRSGSNTVSDPDTIAVNFSAKDVESIANFQAYGFLPELIARFTRVIPFEALSEDILMQILQSEVVDHMIDEFHQEGIELEIHPCVFDHVVNEALERETGARGLSATLTRYLEDVAFDSFGLEGNSRKIIVSMSEGSIDVSITNPVTVSGLSTNASETPKNPPSESSENESNHTESGPE